MSELFRLKATSLKMGDNLKVGHRHDSYKKYVIFSYQNWSLYAVLNLAGFLINQWVN